MDLLIFQTENGYDVFVKELKTDPYGNERMPAAEIELSIYMNQ